MDEVHVVPSTSTEATIEKLRIILSTHGIPDQLVSDNGSRFASQEFSLFMKMNGIKHTLTSPYHPNSNGLAECDVQTFKKGIRKLEGDVEFQDFYLDIELLLIVSLVCHLLNY